MHDACRVRFSERIARLNHVLADLVARQSVSLFLNRRKIFAVEVLHHDVRAPIRKRTRIQHGGDVPAPQPAHRSDLPQKTAFCVGKRQCIVAKKLDRDARRRLQIERADNRAHRTGSEHVLDAIPLRDDGAGRELHLILRFTGASPLRPYSPAIG